MTFDGLLARLILNASFGDIMLVRSFFAKVLRIEPNCKAVNDLVSLAQRASTNDEAAKNELRQWLEGQWLQISQRL